MLLMKNVSPLPFYYLVYNELLALKVLMMFKEHAAGMEPDQTAHTCRLASLHTACCLTPHFKPDIPQTDHGFF